MSVSDAVRVAVGLDIGGTKLSLGLVDGAGRVLARGQMATQSRRGLADAVARVATIVEGLLSKAGGQSWSSRPRQRTA